MSKILIICKRRPQQRCLMSRPYGRFFHIPLELSKLGNEVHIIVIGHSGDHAAKAIESPIYWHSFDIRINPLSMLPEIIRLAKKIKPDFVIGVSDAWTGCLSDIVSRAVKSKLIIDAYDNYESYMPLNFPLHYLWRKAIYNADLCTAAGPQLASLMDLNRNGKSKTKILPMAADPEFYPRPKFDCRIDLNLPVESPIIGYSGGWASNRGTDMLIDAFKFVRESRPDAILALTGKPPAKYQNEPGVMMLGYLTDSQMPIFLNSLDVSAVITADTNFGRYSYPVKLCEAMACRIPVVATGSEPVKWMLNDSMSYISPVNDYKAFGSAVLQQLIVQERNYPEPIRWPAIAAELHDMIQATKSYRSTSG